MEDNQLKVYLSVPTVSKKEEVGPIEKDVK